VVLLFDRRAPKPVVVNLVFNIGHRKVVDVGVPHPHIALLVRFNGSKPTVGLVASDARHQDGLHIVMPAGDSPYSALFELRIHNDVNRRTRELVFKHDVRVVKVATDELQWPPHLGACFADELLGFGDCNTSVDVDDFFGVAVFHCVVCADE
jgi:hypothetical protein